MDIHKIASEIKERLDIVDVISEYIPDIKKRGRSYIALCPFHSEKTPSFTVSREKQLFYCFGCHAGGDMIKFVSLYENTTYVEAIKKLALKAGMDAQIIDPINHSSEEDKEKIIIKKINYEASELFSRYLRTSDGKKALSILKERGFKEETISEFNIGYAPDSYDALYRELSKKYPEKLLLKSQIVSSASGRIIDSFRNRIIIPIKSVSGDVLGFGARAIEEGEQPKYLNSSETSVFSKRRTLFGIYNSIQKIRKEKKAIIVEGYMDAMMMHQYMFGITISPLGTSFTYEQAKTIKNYVDEVIIMFDSDNAGINAAIKAADIFTDIGVYSKIALLPRGVDPDEYLIKNGADEMIELLKSAKDIIDFKITMIKNQKTQFKPDEKMKIIDFMAPTLLKQQNEIIKIEWIKKISQIFSIPEHAINNYLFKNFSKAKQQLSASQNSSETVTIEENLIDMLLANPNLIKLATDISSEQLSSDFSKKIFDFIKNASDFKEIHNLLIEAFPEYKNKIMKHIISPSLSEDTLNESNFKKTLTIVKKNHMEREWKKLKDKIPNLTPEEFERFNKLTVELKNIKI